MRKVILLLVLAAGCRGDRAEPASESPPTSGTVTAPRSMARGLPPGPYKRTNPAGAHPEPVDAIGIPRFAGGELPVYPDLSARLEEEGVVELRFALRENGSVKELGIAKSSGYDRLDAAALAAARTWRFNPTTGGGDVEVVRYRLQFRLVDE